MDTATANALLPEEPSSAIPNPKALVYTLIAEPKWGKSTWFGSIPNSLILAFEQGHAFIKAHKVIIDAWDYNRREKPDPYRDAEGNHHMTMMQAVEVLLVSDRFDFVVIDTTDMAVKMCVDYHLKKLGLSHQTDWDFGKGHDMAQNTPFRQAMGQIIKSGRGVGFITHTEIKTSQFANTQQKSKRDCTLSGGIIKFVVPQSDVILNGQFGPRLSNGKRSRILVTEGADDVLAGMRGNVDVVLPPKFIVNHENPWGQWESFFNSPEAVEQAMDEYAALRGSQQNPEQPPQTEASPAKKAPKAKAR
jgi:hypothetical protein